MKIARLPRLRLPWSRVVCPRLPRQKVEPCSFEQTFPNQKVEACSFEQTFPNQKVEACSFEQSFPNQKVKACSFEQTFPGEKWGRARLFMALPVKAEPELFQQLYDSKIN